MIIWIYYHKVNLILKSDYNNSKIATLNFYQNVHAVDSADLYGYMYFLKGNIFLKMCSD